MPLCNANLHFSLTYYGKEDNMYILSSKMTNISKKFSLPRRMPLHARIQKALSEGVQTPFPPLSGSAHTFMLF